MVGTGFRETTAEMDTQMERKWRTKRNRDDLRVRIILWLPTKSWVPCFLSEGFYKKVWEDLRLRFCCLGFKAEVCLGCGVKGFQSRR